jgi:ligand-binding sensor domain-containing protein
MRKKLYSLFLLLLLPISIHALIPDIKFRRLDTRDGLSNSQVNCVYRDSRGFVWMGTAYGLNRYDGYRFKTFYSNKRDTTSMRDNYTDEIMEAYDGKLWLKQGMNYCVYDPIKESFERNVSRILSEYGITGGVERLYVDCKQRFWVKCYDDGIYCYDPRTEKLSHIRRGYERGQFNPNYGISTFSSYGDKVVLSTYQGELVLMDGSKGVIEWESTWIRDHGGPRNQEYKLFIDQQFNVWVTSLGNTYIYIAREQRWYPSLEDLMRSRHFENPPQNLQIWDVKADRRGWLWLATDHEGVFVINLKTRQCRQFLNNKFDQSTISENTCKHIYVDRSGSVWIGTYKNGVNQYLEGVSSLKSIELGDINTVCEDRYGNYWIGSNDRGILVYNPKSNEVVRQYTTQNSNLSSNIMVGSCYASDGSIWYGSYNGGLVRCIPSQNDPTEAQIINYRSETGSGLAINNVWSVTEDRWHRIWMATLGGGIQMLDLKTNRFRTWNSENAKLPSNYLTSVWWIKKGWLMVGTSWYYCFVNPVTGKLANRIIPDDPNVPVNTGTSVCVMEDSRGLIWQGSTSGAAVYDPHTQRVFLLDMTSGLMGSSVCSIVEDNAHMMWVVTDHGVSKVIPEQQEDGSWQFTVRSYTSSDGLQKGTYNQRSAYLTRGGLLLVGGQGGLDIINPKGLSSTRSKERPMFSGLQLFDVDVPVGKEIDGRIILDEALNICRDITLRFSDQFTIQLSSDAGNVNNEKRFVYKLEGFNDNWVKTSEMNPNITYNSLRAGSYTLCVRMLNDDGSIGEEEASMDITIVPPIWRKRWAILLYMVVIVAIALVWRRWFMKRQGRRMETETIRRDLEMKQWMNEVRMKLKKEYSEKNGTTDHPGEAMTNYHVVARCRLGDIVDFLRQFCNDFVSPDKNKLVKVNFFSPVSELETEYDGVLLSDALRILFNNSVLFAHDDSLISVGVVRQQDGHVQIQIADNGIGIKDEFKEHAFDPMMNDDGIGLDRVKAIIDAHEGTICIKDNPGGGTIFVITLPPAEEIEDAVLLDD